jgi:hypothetical protein
MLHSHSKPVPFFPEGAGANSAAHASVPPPLGGGPGDAAIDAALCRVPLPDGLINRLAAMAVNFTEDDGKMAH